MAGTRTLFSDSPERTALLAVRFVEALKRGSELLEGGGRYFGTNVITLEGAVGCGKSLFCRSFIRSWLSRRYLVVPSPSYPVVQHFDAADGVTLYHLDLYRLSEFYEFEALDLDLGDCSSIFLIEWPELVERLMGDNFLKLRFAILDDYGRELSFFSRDDILLSRVTSIL